MVLFNQANFDIETDLKRHINESMDNKNNKIIYQCNLCQHKLLINKIARKTFDAIMLKFKIYN